MPGRPRGHDRIPAAPDQDPIDAVRLRGAVFLRGEYSEPWAYRSMPTRDLAAVLAPDAARVLLFHVVASGRCWIETDDSPRLWAGAGDVIVLPYGDHHRMGGTDDAEVVSATALVSPPPWSEMPVIRYGQGGPATHVVCGYLVSDDPLFDPRLRALPPVFVVSPPQGPARAFVTASIDYALHRTSRVAIDRLEGPREVSELLLREVLRLHLADAPATDRGWLGALRDPVLAPAMAGIHGRPEHKWSVAGLAALAHVSPSLLDERFRDVLGRPPIRYLTEWRMHLARGLLGDSDLGVGAVGRRVGYDSEEAFSRAFKRAHGTAPTRWRRSRV